MIKAMMKDKLNREREIEMIKEKFYQKVLHYKDREPNKNENKLGDLIKKLREEKGWDRHELGSLIGVSKTTIYAWERGKYTPFGKSLRKLSLLFQYPFENYSSRNNRVVGTNIPPKEYEIFSIKCEELGISKSDFIRECIRIFFDTRG